MGEYVSTFMRREYVHTMIIGEVGDLTLWLTRYYTLGRHKEALWIIERVTLAFKRKYRHEEALLIISRVTFIF